MSNPDIYTIKLMGYPEAQFVLFSDYERLKSEVESLMTTPASRLLRASRAENERLIKAGDELNRILASKVASYEVGNASNDWNAAKDGNKTK